jgi:hypothetical protein
LADAHLPVRAGLSDDSEVSPAGMIVLSMKRYDYKMASGSALRRKTHVHLTAICGTNSP